MKAAAAYDAGWYEDLVVPFMDAEEDNNIRRDTTFEKLQKRMTELARGKGMLARA